MTKLLATCLLPAFILLASACGGGQQADDAAPDEAEGEPAAGMQGMEGMGGMGGMQSSGMMDQMMAHMQMMQGMSADSMAATLPAHRQMAANMLAQMNREMRDMDMTADEGWTATVDSLRDDLTRMPEMSGTELQQLMPGHHRRMLRLMELHRTMMSNMRR